MYIYVYLYNQLNPHDRVSKIYKAVDKKKVKFKSKKSPHECFPLFLFSRLAECKFT